MRGWLIFLALAAPLVLLNPLFWWLVGTEIGASAVTYVEKDGARRDALLGPHAPWPDWARLPDRYRLIVRSQFASAPGYPASGLGEIEFSTTLRDAVADVQRELTQAGWQVTTVLATTYVPSLPPRPVLTCVLTATQSEPHVRSITIAFDQVDRVARIHWLEAEPRPIPSRPDAGDC